MGCSVDKYYVNGWWVLATLLMSLFILILKYLCSVHSFCCCPSPLILGHYSSVIIIHCFPLCLAKKMIFFPPSFVFFHCARWFLTHFCSTAASGQQNVHPAHDRWWPHLTSYKDHLVFLGRFSKHSSRFSPGPQTWVTNSCRKKIKPAS